tara:strand:- start:4001 stop:4786 length:786 start_codon:yes stop_codon:yes gene_type:complete
MSQNNDWFIDQADEQFNFDHLIDDNPVVVTNNNVKTNYTNIWNRSVNKKADITFIGDSVIDNKSYTGTGKGTVDYFAEHYANPTYMSRINDQAVDGFTVYDVLNNTSKVVGNTVVISAGGNDLLAKINMLKDNHDTNTVMALMNQELDILALAYETILSELSQSGRNFVLLTCYDGNLAFNPNRFNNIDHVAKAIVSMWNDRLYRIANKYDKRNNNQSYDVLDTRHFMSHNCFYNEIEPNKRGAIRIAKNIIKLLVNKGVL